MDYEKKYKESMAKMFTFLAKHDGFTISKDGEMYKELSDIFPELRESEDEKMRKGIIRNLEYLMDRAEGFVKDELKERIAWLEKQGENANFRNKIQIGDKVTRNEDGVLVNLSQLNRVAKKQGEQKPTNKVEPKFKVKYAGCEYNVLEVKDIAGVTYYGIEDEPNHIDYVKADNCKIISGGYGIKENGSPYPTKTAVFSEQKPAWSEEDEIAFGDALWCCKQAASIAKDENEMGNAWYAERWLKALKDRYTWKPSDEQMITLRHVISGCSYDIEPLVELETKLKEL